MTRPRTTNTPTGDLAASIADLGERIRTLETVGHRHDGATYSAANSPRAYRTSAVSIANNTLTTLDYEAVDDTAWGAWTIANPSLLTAPVTGRYFAVATVRWVANTSGYRTLSIYRAADDVIVGSVQVNTVGSAVSTRLTVTSPAITLAAGESLYCAVQQTSGGALNVDVVATDLAPSFSLILLG